MQWSRSPSTSSTIILFKYNIIIYHNNIILYYTNNYNKYINVCTHSNIISYLILNNKILYKLFENVFNEIS